MVERNAVTGRSGQDPPTPSEGKGQTTGLRLWVSLLTALLGTQRPTPACPPAAGLASETGGEGTTAPPDLVPEASTVVCWQRGCWHGGPLGP